MNGEVNLAKMCEAVQTVRLIGTTFRLIFIQEERNKVDILSSGQSLIEMTSVGKIVRVCLFF